MRRNGNWLISWLGDWLISGAAYNFRSFVLLKDKFLFLYASSVVCRR